MSKVLITDHAVLRYLERVGDYDIEEIRREMADAVKDSVLVFGGTCKPPVGDGKHAFVMVENRMVSVVPK